MLRTNFYVVLARPDEVVKHSLKMFVLFLELFKIEQFFVEETSVSESTLQNGAPKVT